MRKFVFIIVAMIVFSIHVLTCGLWLLAYGVGCGAKLDGHKGLGVKGINGSMFS